MSQGLIFSPPLFLIHTLVVVFSGPNALNLSMVMMSSLLSPALNSPLSLTFLYSTAYVASLLRHLIHITSNIAWIKHNSSFTPKPNLCLSYLPHLRKWHIIDAVTWVKNLVVIFDSALSLTQQSPHQQVPSTLHLKYIPDCCYFLLALLLPS